MFVWAKWKRTLSRNGGLSFKTSPNFFQTSSQVWKCVCVGGGLPSGTWPSVAGNREAGRAATELRLPSPQSPQSQRSLLAQSPPPPPPPLSSWPGLARETWEETRGAAVFRGPSLPINLLPLVPDLIRPVSACRVSSVLRRSVVAVWFPLLHL